MKGGNFRAQKHCRKRHQRHNHPEHAVAEEIIRETGETVMMAILHPSRRQDVSFTCKRMTSLPASSNIAWQPEADRERYRNAEFAPLSTTATPSFIPATPAHYAAIAEINSISRALQRRKSLLLSAKIMTPPPPSDHKYPPPRPVASCLPVNGAKTVIGRMCPAINKRRPESASSGEPTPTADQPVCLLLAA